MTSTRIKKIKDLTYFPMRIFLLGPFPRKSSGAGLFRTKGLIGLESPGLKKSMLSHIVQAGILTPYSIREALWVSLGKFPSHTFLEMLKGLPEFPGWKKGNVGNNWKAILRTLPQI